MIDSNRPRNLTARLRAGGLLAVFMLAGLLPESAPAQAFFTTLADGVGYPSGGLILSGDTLYGTTSAGGISGLGTVFSLKLPVPPLISFLQGLT